MTKEKFEKYFVQFFFASIVILALINIWVMVR